MRRREFITVVWGAAVWPLTARSQQPVLPMLGFLSSRAPAESASLVEAFGAGLKEGGYVVAVRSVEARYEPGLHGVATAMRPQ
jgi:putative tryptophan/tyrosine transport system substrate-binding protein